MKYSIDVTEEDIHQGEVSSLSACPIALAVQRTFNVDSRRVRVGFTSIELSRPPRLDFVSLPHEAQEFVQNFDLIGRHSVKPLSFEIEVP